MKRRLILCLAMLLPLAFAGAARAAPPTVEMTWMSIANWYFKIGEKRIVMDGYITRVPEAQFMPAPGYPNDLYAFTRAGYGVDQASIGKVRDACSPATSSTCCWSGTATSTTAGTRRPGRA